MLSDIQSRPSGSLSSQLPPGAYLLPPGLLQATPAFWPPPARASVHPRVGSRGVSILRAEEVGGGAPETSGICPAPQALRSREGAPQGPPAPFCTPTPIPRSCNPFAAPAPTPLWLDRLSLGLVWFCVAWGRGKERKHGRARCPAVSPFRGPPAPTAKGLFPDHVLISSGRCFLFPWAWGWCTRPAVRGTGRGAVSATDSSSN